MLGGRHSARPPTTASRTGCPCGGDATSQPRKTHRSPDSTGLGRVCIQFSNLIVKSQLIARQAGSRIPSRPLGRRNPGGHDERSPGQRFERHLNRTPRISVRRVKCERSRSPASNCLSPCDSNRHRHRTPQQTDFPALSPAHAKCRTRSTACQRRTRPTPRPTPRPSSASRTQRPRISNTPHHRLAAAPGPRPACPATGMGPPGSPPIRLDSPPLSAWADLALATPTPQEPSVRSPRRESGSEPSCVRARIRSLTTLDPARNFPAHPRARA